MKEHISNTKWVIVPVAIHSVVPEISVLGYIQYGGVYMKEITYTFDCLGQYQ